MPFFPSFHIFLTVFVLACVERRISIPSHCTYKFFFLFVSHTQCPFEIALLDSQTLRAAVLAKRSLSTEGVFGETTNNFLRSQVSAFFKRQKFQNKLNCVAFEESRFHDLIRILILLYFEKLNPNTYLVFIKSNMNLSLSFILKFLSSIHQTRVSFSPPHIFWLLATTISCWHLEFVTSACSHAFFSSNFNKCLFKRLSLNMLTHFHVIVSYNKKFLLNHSENYLFWCG